MEVLFRQRNPEFITTIDVLLNPIHLETYNFFIKHLLATIKIIIILSLFGNDKSDEICNCCDRSFAHWTY